MTVTENYELRGQTLLIENKAYVIETVFENEFGQPLTVMCKVVDPAAGEKPWAVFDARGWEFKEHAAQ